MCFTVTPPAIAFPKENITDISFVVQWDTVNQSADRYILMWTDGTTPIQSVTVDGTSYTVTGLTPNTTYTVSVTVVNNCTGSLSTNAMVMTRMPFSMDANTTCAITTITVTASVFLSPNTTTTISSATAIITSTTINTVDTTSKFRIPYTIKNMRGKTLWMLANCKCFTTENFPAS